MSARVQAAGSAEVQKRCASGHCEPGGFLLLGGGRARSRASSGPAVRLGRGGSQRNA